MPHLSDEQLESIIDDGLTLIFKGIQDALGQDDGGFAAHWMNPNLEKRAYGFLKPYFRDYADAEAKNMEAVPKWKVGDVLMLSEPFEAYPHFYVPAGAVGTVVMCDESMLSVLMRDHIDGCEEWDNEITLCESHLDMMSQDRLDAMWKKIGTDPYTPMRIALKRCAEVLSRVCTSDTKMAVDVNYAVGHAFMALGAIQNEED